MIEKNIKVHILNGGKGFGRNFEYIKDITYRSLEQIIKIIPIKNIDIIIYATSFDYNIIPEIGIGGRTVNSSIIFIPIDPTFKNIKETIKTELPDTLAHEINHAARWRYSDIGSTLLDAMIFEGLACHFASEMYGLSHPWNKALSYKELVLMLEKAKPEFKNINYDYHSWFFGSKDIPMWTGYTLGYEIVGNYLKAHPKMKASDIYKMRSNVFIADHSYYNNIIKKDPKKKRSIIKKK